MAAPTDSGDLNPPLIANGAASQVPANQENHPSGQQAVPPKALTAGFEKSDIEEPELALEPDLPSDGRDFVGEAMIHDLPQQAMPKVFPSPL